MMKFNLGFFAGLTSILSCAFLGEAFAPGQEVRNTRIGRTDALHASVAATNPFNEEKKETLSFSRAKEIIDITLDHAMPLLGSAFSGTYEEGDTFWLAKTNKWENNEEITNADRAVVALKRLCPNYIRYASAVASRTHAIPAPLEKALSAASSDAAYFEFETAKKIVELELTSAGVEDVVIAILVDTLSQDYAVNGIEQVYQAFLPNVGIVSVRVQNPALKVKVRSEADLLKNVAAVTNTLTTTLKSKGIKPVEVVDALSSSIFKHTDYTNDDASSEICTENVMVSKVIGEAEDVEELSMVQQGGSFTKVFGVLTKSLLGNRKPRMMNSIVRFLSLGQLELI